MKAATARHNETLEFTTPIPLVAAVEEVDIRPAEIQRWLDDLPRANPELSAGRIIDALTNLHRRDVDDTQRLDALEVYRLPVASIVDALQAKFETQSIPLSERAKQSVDLAQQLLTGLATGYMRSARNFVNHENRDPKSVHTLFAIQRSIYHLGQVLLNSYLTYRAAVPGVWSDLYELYRYAESEALLLESVTIEGVGIVDSTTTIDATFQHILLVSSGDPGGMQMGECKRLYELLKRIQDKVTISSKVSWSDPIGRFVFDLSSDEPPVPLAATPDLYATTDHRSVNCLKAVAGLHNSLKSSNKARYAESGQLVDVSNLELLRRAAKKWAGNPGRRQSVRSPQMLDLHVCSGIGGTHYYAFGERNFVEFEQKANGVQPQSRKSTDEQTDEHEIYINLAAKPDDAGWINPGPRVSAEESISTFESTLDRRLHHKQTARMMDESAGGVRLRLFTGSMVRLLVGEIVSMRYREGDSWRVGMVRWLNASAKDYVDVGVMFLSPTVIPVALLRTDPGDRGITMIPALYLPGVERLDTSESVVVPRGTHRFGDEMVIVSSNGSKRRVTPLKLEQRTSSFEQIVIGAPTR